MNRAKGFTLIELIGVVVILGILMILVFPSILNNIKKAKNNITETEKEVLMSATKLYIEENQNQYRTYNGSKYCITVEELYTQNKIQKELFQNVGNDTVVQVTTQNNYTDYKIITDGTCLVSHTNIWVKANQNEHGVDGASIPDLESNMIPIKYRTEQDSTDTWYDYRQRMWANAAIVKEKEREKYKNSPVGTEIKEEDILAYFVWIPRYRYKLWNVAGKDSNVRSIEIEFEGTSTKISTGYTNNTWLTHPAFCIGRTGDPTVSVGNYGTDRNSCSGTEINGIWVGKFEPSIGNINQTNEIKTAGVVIKPNQISLGYQDSYNQFQTAWSLASSYHLNTNYQTRMIRNTEWGAVAYLAHSKYGIGVERIRTNNTTIAPIGIKDDSDTVQNPTITGCAYKNDESVAYGATSCNTSNSVPYDDQKIGVKASTTGNIYGIYDMSGGTMERTASIKFSEGAEHAFSAIDERYYERYDGGTSRFDLNPGRLGDATQEITNMINSSQAISWYENVSNSMFFRYDNEVMIRGRGYYTSTAYEDTQKADVMFFGTHNASLALYRDSFRIVMNKQKN